MKSATRSRTRSRTRTSASSSDTATIITTIVIIIIVILAYSCSLGNNDHYDQAIRALEAYGLTNITIGKEYVPFLRGGDGDDFAFDAEGTTSTGKRVKVTVYMGFLKDATVRVR